MDNHFNEFAIELSLLGHYRRINKSVISNPEEFHRYTDAVLKEYILRYGTPPNNIFTVQLLNELTGVDYGWPNMEEQVNETHSFKCAKNPKLKGKHAKPFYSKSRW